MESQEQAHGRRMVELDAYWQDLSWRVDAPGVTGQALLADTYGRIERTRAAQSEAFRACLAALREAEASLRSIRETRQRRAQELSARLERPLPNTTHPANAVRSRLSDEDLRAVGARHAERLRAVRGAGRSGRGPLATPGRGPRPR